MKKQTIILMFAAAMAFSITASADEVTYDGDVFTFSYDDYVFTVLEGEEQSVAVTAIDMPDDGGGHNTILGCIVTENTAYEDLGNLSASDKEDFMNTFVRTMCRGAFDVDDGVTVENETYKQDGDAYEYHMSLSDGTECFAKIFEYGETVPYALCRLCTYTKDLNDDYREIYESMKLSKEDETETETETGTESVVEAETASVPETESETESETFTETETESESETFVETETESETPAETEVEYETEIPQETEIATETESSTESVTSAFTFRGYDWGTSLDEIKQNEVTSDMVENVDYGMSGNTLIILNSKVSSYDASVIFEFDNDNKLISGGYSLTEEHTDDSGYYDDFIKLTSSYAKKYGLPEQSDVWKNNLYKDDVTKWGFAAACGHVSFLRYWDADDGSSISISLSGDNFETSTFVLYRSPNYGKEDDMTGI